MQYRTLSSATRSCCTPAWQLLNTSRLGHGTREGFWQRWSVPRSLWKLSLCGCEDHSQSVSSLVLVLSTGVLQGMTRGTELAASWHLVSMPQLSAPTPLTDWHMLDAYPLLQQNVLLEPRALHDSISFINMPAAHQLWQPFLRSAGAHSCVGVYFEQCR